MRFEWDEAKNGRNLLKHDVGFETAVLVFDDPYALTQPAESSEDEQRWITLGEISPGAVLVVVHTWFERERTRRSFEALPRVPPLRVRGVQMSTLPISSRRRHTRSDRDWSSDVCSSD